MGGHAAKVAREDIEKSLGESVVTKKNALNYKYIDDILQLNKEDEMQELDDLIKRR